VVVAGVAHKAQHASKPQNMPKNSKEYKVRGATLLHAGMPFVYQSMLPFVYQPMLTHSACASCDSVCGCGRRGTGRSLARSTKTNLVPVTAFQQITGGALQKIGEFDNQAEASAAAGIPGQLQKNGQTAYRVVLQQLQNPTKKQSKPTASSSRESYYFIYTFQLEDAITDVDIKVKLALRGTAAARKELKDWRRSQAGT
jgi:hypothetical protein